MTNSFYRAFEDRQRGSRDLIKERLQIYMPFVKSLLNFYPEGEVIDIGCGRGEWLELLVDAGFKPRGVDLDEGMLQACQLLNLPAVQADALEFLTKTESSSQLAISAFHVVEHISFDQLQVFVHEALRVLKPGGLLIMETPNPENIAVATRNFYLDPTHQRPIPPQLLSFVAEFAGFERVKTLRLQEPKEIANRETIGLTEVINCVSPDYSVVAQKTADASLLAHSEALFAADYGISLDALSLRLDQRLAHMEAQSIKALDLAQQAEAKAQQAEDFFQQNIVQLQAMYNSRSWRITKPFRIGKLLLRTFIGRALRFAVRKGKALMQRFPTIRPIAMWVLRRSPILMRVVMRFSENSFNVSVELKKPVSDFRQLASTRIMLALANLPPRGNEGPVTFLEVNDDVR